MSFRCSDRLILLHWTGCSPVSSLCWANQQKHIDRQRIISIFLSNSAWKLFLGTSMVELLNCDNCEKKKRAWHLVYSLPEGRWETLKSAGWSFHGVMRPTLSFFSHQTKHHDVGHVITNVPSPAWSLKVVALRCGDVSAGSAADPGRSKLAGLLHVTWFLVLYQKYIF